MAYLPSVCPHDCPSTCALEVERLDKRTIGRIRGAKSNSYTAGVICAKVARYSERVHHPNRLLNPLIRAGGKGNSKLIEASWDEALDKVLEILKKNKDKAYSTKEILELYESGEKRTVLLCDKTHKIFESDSITRSDQMALLMLSFFMNVLANI